MILEKSMQTEKLHMASLVSTCQPAIVMLSEGLSHLCKPNSHTWPVLHLILINDIMHEPWLHAFLSVQRDSGSDGNVHKLHSSHAICFSQVSSTIAACHLAWLYTCQCLNAEKSLANSSSFITSTITWLHGSISSSHKLVRNWASLLTSAHGTLPAWEMVYCDRLDF